MKRLLVLLVLAALAVPLLAADCQNGMGNFSFTVLGPELHDNLWQFASVRGWPSTASTTSFAGGHNHARLLFQGTQFGVADTPCAYGLSGPDGTTLVIVAEYSEDPNTTAQRGFYAAASFVTANPAPAISNATMREVPPVTAVNNAGTITVAWTEPPAQPEIIGYRVVRSADGIAGWTTVGDVATGVTSQPDTPGTGTWHYALQLRYLGSPVQQVSPHGLSASVTVP